MSVFIMSQVWRNSPNKGVELLIELALADFADDAGYSFPSIDTIAQKARCSRRYVMETIRALEVSGRVLVEPNMGPRGTNIYRFMPMVEAVD